jgi:uncharacterized protein YbjT (DUF2867 family)
MKRYLIVGASGTVGSHLVQFFVKKGEKVRAATSKKAPSSSENGIEWVHLDLSSGNGLKEAFEGVDRAFFLSPPGYARQDLILSPLIQEAKRRKLEKVVLMTAYGANAVETSPLRKAEVELENSGLPYAIIRPNWFMQNFHTFWLDGIKNKQNLLLPAGDARVSFIDARDISEVAFQLLTSNTHQNRAFDLTGSESLSHDEVAKILSEVTGKKIGYQNIDPAILKKQLVDAGLPEDYSDFMIMILGALRAGYSSGITTHVKELLGREPLTLRNYAKNYSHFWK